MTLQETVSHHLRASRESMRALSIRAGLGEKFVADLLCGRSRRPSAHNLAKLGDAIGVDLLSIPLAAAQTYGDLIARLEADPPPDWTADRRAAVLLKLRWLVRRQNWDAATQVVDRRKIVEIFDRATPAALGLTRGSKATYKSDILAGVDAARTPARARDVSDITGPWRKLHLAVQAADYPLDLSAVAGPFFLFAHDRGIATSDVAPEVLRSYFDDRCTQEQRTEAGERKAVKRVASLLTRVANDPAFAHFGVRPVAHPFPDGRDKYGVGDALFADLLAEFDARVAPWVTGAVSRDGLSRSELVARLDAEAPVLTGDEALLARFCGSDPESRRAARDAEMLRIGFLPHDRTWSGNTLRTRRGYVLSVAKSVYAATGVTIRSVAQLTTPLVLNAAATAITESNPGDYTSGYVESILKAMKKIAVGFNGASPEDVKAIESLISHHTVDADGICPRNVAKLKRFTPARIDAFVNLGRTLVAGVNARAERNRQRVRKEKGRAATTAEIYDVEMVRDVMTAIAHEIMIKRAPRSDNVKQIRLDWIRWLDGTATIVIPAEEIKGRKAGGKDLLVPLSPWASKLLRSFIDRIRPTILADHAAANPYLFPFQGDACDVAAGAQAYESLLHRLVRAVHEHVGVEMHPHLYRHLLGWIWLREDLRRLPEVQKLLGHRSLETTVRYYAQIDETLCLQDWQDFLERKADARNAA